MGKIWWNETSFPEKEAFYSELCFEDSTDEDYIHAQKVFEEFMFIWQACLKNIGVKLELLTDAYVIDGWK